MPAENYRFIETESVSQKFAKDFPTPLERVPQEQVIDTATGLSEFYDLSSLRYAQGIRIPVFRAEKEAIQAALQREGEWTKNPTTQDELDFGVAVTLTYPGTPVVLVSQKIKKEFPTALRHEIIHGMAPLDKDRTINTANEAVVSVLEVARRNKHLPFFEVEVKPKEQRTLFGSVSRGEQGLSYWESAFALMVIMAATYYGSHPFTPKQLARHYFEGGDYYQIPLEMELMEKIPPPVFEEIKPHFQIFVPFR